MKFKTAFEARKYLEQTTPKRDLPVQYNALSSRAKREVREQYMAEQKGLCYYCKGPLCDDPPKAVSHLPVKAYLFPTHFFNRPVHLHHSHKTGLTLGAVHALCNARLFEDYGE